MRLRFIDSGIYCPGVVRIIGITESGDFYIVFFVHWWLVSFNDNPNHSQVRVLFEVVFGIIIFNYLNNIFYFHCVLFRFEDGGWSIKIRKVIECVAVVMRVEFGTTGLGRAKV